MRVSKSIAKKNPGPDLVTKEFCGLQHSVLETLIKEMRKESKEGQKELKKQIKETHEVVVGNGRVGLKTRMSLVEQRTLLLSILALTFIGVLVEQFFL